MDYDYFNPETYMVIDKITGEELDVAIFIDSAKKSGWEKAYAEMLSSYIKCGSAKTTDLLAWVIGSRDGSNLIQGTQEEIAEQSGVSIFVVKKVFKELYEKGFLKRVRSGCNMVSPTMIRNGDNRKGAMMLRMWDYDERTKKRAEVKSTKKATTRVAKLEAPEYVGFDRFWNIYPKKTKRKECEKIWKRLKPSLEQFGVIAGHLQIAYVSTDKKFIPNPSSYLNGELWNDEVITEAPKTGFDSEVNSWERQPTSATFNGNTFDGELN